MKKLFQISAILFSLVATSAFAFNGDSNFQDDCAPQETVAQQCPPEQAVGECYCLMCRWEPCYYNDWKCVEYPVTTKKKCCRKVPQYYEVQKCRMVPQYYCETKCRYCNEYYYVDECKTCKKWVCEKKCKYVPKYYYKKTCVAPGAVQAPAQQACCPR